MMLEEIRIIDERMKNSITDERMKNSITEERRTHIPHTVSSPALQHV